MQLFFKSIDKKLLFFLNLLGNDTVSKTNIFYVFNNKKKIFRTAFLYYGGRSLNKIEPIILPPGFKCIDFLRNNSKVQKVIFQNIKDKLNSIKKLKFKDLEKQNFTNKLKNFFQIFIYKCFGNHNVGFFDRFAYKINIKNNYIEVLSIFIHLSETEFSIMLEKRNDHFSNYINYYTNVNKKNIDLNITPIEFFNLFSSKNKLESWFKSFFAYQKLIISPKPQLPIIKFPIFYKYENKFIPNWKEIYKLDAILKNYNLSLKDICNDEIKNFNNLILSELSKI